MAIRDIFSKRQARQRGEIHDVYQYDEIPNRLRVQIVQIAIRTLGSIAEYNNNSNVHNCYQEMVEALCEEYGVFYLPAHDEHARRNYMEEFYNSFLHEENSELAIDYVEIICLFIDTTARQSNYTFRPHSSRSANEALDQINYRFKENGVGYQYGSGEIIRIDSQHIHAEVVQPALRLLNSTDYLGAQEEFLSAHEHYRHGRNTEALNECLKAFESMMKSICVKRGWAFAQNANASTLIKICLDNGLIPTFWQSKFTTLRTLLQDSIPTGRNRLSGHGRGTEDIEVPGYIASYMLHMTAAAVVFLAEAENNL